MDVAEDVAVNDGVFDGVRRAVTDCVFVAVCDGGAHVGVGPANSIARMRLLFRSATKSVVPAIATPDGPLKRATGSDPSANPAAPDQAPPRTETVTGDTVTSVMTRILFPASSATYSALPKKTRSTGD